MSCCSGAFRGYEQTRRQPYRTTFRILPSTAVNDNSASPSYRASQSQFELDSQVPYGHTYKNPLQAPHPHPQQKLLPAPRDLERKDSDASASPSSSTDYASKEVSEMESPKVFRDDRPPAQGQVVMPAAKAAEFDEAPAPPADGAYGYNMYHRFYGNGNGNNNGNDTGNGNENQ